MAESGANCWQNAWAAKNNATKRKGIFFIEQNEKAPVYCTGTFENYQILFIVHEGNFGRAYVCIGQTGISSGIHSKHALVGGGAGVGIGIA
jgi:hypothetical protein